MAQPRRQQEFDDHDLPSLTRAPTPTAQAPFSPGGEVGRMHADLARRLVYPPVAAPSPGERLVRFLSVAGGYGALAAGYVGAAWLILR